MKLGMIGTGRMAQAIVGGLLQSGSIPPEQIYGTDPHEESCRAFLKLDPQGRLGWAVDLASLLPGCTILLIAVKPQQIGEVLPVLKGADAGACVVSIAAGVSMAQLEAELGVDRPIIRVMPNTPMMVGRGVVAWCGNAALTIEHAAAVDTLFGAVASVHRVEEKEMDAVTALSGSGPAFFYRLIQYMEEAAVAEGLAPERARVMAAVTAMGAAEMLLRTGLEPGELVAQVRSKGGTTEAGLAVLEQGLCRNLLTQTITAAASRSRELGS
ncbi:MAG: pyrroline-5-carboxylate reductase [Candidatus Methylacidiphilales bacterium]